MIFKKGQKVVIRKDLKTRTYYNGCFFCSAMGKYRGKTATIISFTTPMRTNRYRLDIDNGSWSWAPELFKMSYPDWKKLLEDAK